MRGLRFGVEIEWSGGPGFARVAEQIAHDVRGAWRGLGTDIWTREGRWRVVEDGTVPDGGEVISPILEWCDLDELRAVIGAMRTAGCEIDESMAGLHVHVDARDLGYREIKNLWRMVYRHELMLRAVADVNPGRVDQCRWVSVDAIHMVDEGEPLAKAWYHQWPWAPTSAIHESRYSGLNLHNHFRYRCSGLGKDTVEFRWFNSTLDEGLVESYVIMCLALVAKSIDARQVSSRHNVVELQEVSKNMAQLFRFLGITGREFGETRWHLENRVRKGRVPLLEWKPGLRRPQGTSRAVLSEVRV